MSTFSGLGAALTGLYANRRGMEVVAQNIANVNTEGYSRQRAEMQSIGESLIPGIHARAQEVGSGVRVSDVRRVHDMFLENRGRVEHSQQSYLATKQQILGRVEQAFAEPSDTALQSQFSELWTSLHELGNRPGDLASRTAVLQRASIVATTLHGQHEAMGSLWTSSKERLTALASDINAMASTVAQLNKAVVQSVQSGQPANELADQRDAIVLKLSELTGARAYPKDDGDVDVQLAGSSLVYGAYFRPVEVGGANRMVDQAGDPVTIRWADSGAAAEIPGGQMAGLLETLKTTLPGYAADVDKVAASLITAMNTQHALGFDLTGVAGGVFFSGTSASDIAVAITDPSKIAAAATATGTLDGSNADKLAGVADLATGPDRIYRQVVVDLGVAAQTINRRAAIQDTVTKEIDAARAAQSGVNLDEEMTAMVTFERAYQAASKVIQTLDEMLDTLINRMGS